MDMERSKEMEMGGRVEKQGASERWGDRGKEAGKR